MIIQRKLQQASFFVFPYAEFYKTYINFQKILPKTIDITSEQ